MKSRTKEIAIYTSTIVLNVFLGFLFTSILFDGNNDNFIFSTCGTILLSIIIVYSIARQSNYSLDIFADDIIDPKYLILNSIFIGNLFSIPVAMLISAII